MTPERLVLSARGGFQGTELAAANRKFVYSAAAWLIEGFDMMFLGNCSGAKPEGSFR